MITFDFINASHAPITHAMIQPAINRASHKLGDIGDHFVAIECVSEDDIRTLNQTLRQTNESTDIISLSTQETEAGEQHITIGSHGELNFDLTAKHRVNPLPVLGQLIICWEVITAHAVQAGQPPEAELEWVIEHGVYHLMGYHHDHD